MAEADTSTWDQILGIQTIVSLKETNGKDIKIFCVTFCWEHKPPDCWQTLKYRNWIRKMPQTMISKMETVLYSNTKWWKIGTNKGRGTQEDLYHSNKPLTNPKLRVFQHMSLSGGVLRTAMIMLEANYSIGQQWWWENWNFQSQIKASKLGSLAKKGHLNVQR